MKRLTRSPSSRTTIAAARAFVVAVATAAVVVVAVDRVCDPVRRFDTDRNRLQ